MSISYTLLLGVFVLVSALIVFAVDVFQNRNKCSAIRRWMSVSTQDISADWQERQIRFIKEYAVFSGKIRLNKPPIEVKGWIIPVDYKSIGMIRIDFMVLEHFSGGYADIHRISPDCWFVYMVQAGKDGFDF